MKLILFDLGEVLVTLSSNAKAELDSIVGSDHQEMFRAPWFEFMKFRDLYMTVDDDIREMVYWHEFFKSTHRFNGHDIHRLTQIYTNYHSWVYNCGVRSLMSTLNIRGIKRGIISNAFPSMLKVCMSMDLYDSFEPVVLSYLARMMKPDVGIFKLGMKGYDPADCVFIDDNLAFAATASSLGMHGVWLNEHGIVKEIPIGVTEVKSLDEFNTKICSGEIQ